VRPVRLANPLDRDLGSADTHRGDIFVSKSYACAFSLLAAVIALALTASAQSVISTHSGVIYFFEGAVFLGDQPLESHQGTFPCVPQSAELRTADGRAEVLLTPGVFLRMGQRSAIRMIANDLADTQVELRTGSAIVDSGEPNSGTSVTLIYKDWRVRSPQKSAYRIDTDPPRLSVREGEVNVFAGSEEEPITVAPGMSLPLAEVLVPERSSVEPDALGDWANGRDESISADNAITAQIDQDPASGISGLDGFTYFPVLGVPSLAPGLGPSSPYGPYGSYSSYALYQPGFYSLYLPGYTYPPLLLGLVGRGMGFGGLSGLRTYWPSPLRGIGGLPGGGSVYPIPRTPVWHPPVSRPVTPAGPIHIAPHPVVHVGVHH
jgi:hypothetical protein